MAAVGSWVWKGMTHTNSPFDILLSGAQLLPYHTVPQELKWKADGRGALVLVLEYHLGKQRQELVQEQYCFELCCLIGEWDQKGKGET